VIPVFIAAALLFPRLGQRCLWGDEAETALVASTLRTGPLPRVWDGRNLFSIWQGSYNRGLVETLSPWLQYYVAAGPLAVLGHSAFAARLPFAILALATVAAVYFFVLRLSADRAWAFTAALLLSLSVPFLLYARQCRYYALAMLLAVLLLHAYLALERFETLRIAAFSLPATLLFHSNYLLFGCVIGALAVWALLFERSPDRKLGIAFSVMPVAALTVPWLAYAGTLGRGAELLDAGRLARWPRLAGMYARGLDWSGWLPLGVVLLLPLALLQRRRGRLALNRPLLMLLVVTATFLAWLCLVTPQQLSSDWVPDLRYATPLLPLCAILAAAVVVRLYRWRRWAGIVLAALVILTDLPRFPVFGVGHKPSAHRPWARAQGYVMLDLASYVESLRRPYRGAYEDVADFLRRHADPSDYVWCTPPATVEPLIFHTGLRFVNRFQREERPVKDALGKQILFARQAGLPSYVFASDLAVHWVVDFTGKVSIAASTRPSGEGERIPYQTFRIDTVDWHLARPELWGHAFVRDSAIRVPYEAVIHRRRWP